MFMHEGVVMPEQTSSKPADYPYQGSIYSGPANHISSELAEAIQQTEKAFDCPVWALIHQNEGSSIDSAMYTGFVKRLAELRACRDKGGIALIVDSPGGYPEDAYRIATLLRRSCGLFRVLVPRAAYSSATLLSLGAEKLYLGQEAELGPLDLQVMEDGRVQFRPAIDEVQTLDHLTLAAIKQIDVTINGLRGIVPERHVADAYLSHILDFAAKFTNPLLSSINAIHYTEQSRLLRIMESYAVRLLEPNYGPGKAREIALRLVNDYPSHDFVIGYEEADDLLRLAKADGDQQRALDGLCEVLWRGDDVMIGALVDARDQAAGAGPAGPAGQSAVPVPSMP
jgi:hypothetical protein